MSELSDEKHVSHGRGKPVTDGRFGKLSCYFIQVGGDDSVEYEFSNGLVWGLVDAWDDGYMTIKDWSAFEPLRSGNTRNSLKQLKEVFVSLCVSGSYPKDDPEAPFAWRCWEQMFNEGLVDSVEDHHGVRLQKPKSPKP